MIDLQKQKRDNEHLAALQKIITLEKLCRALQEERTLMQMRLKMNNEEPNEEPNEELNEELNEEPNEEKEDSVPNGDA